MSLTWLILLIPLLAYALLKIRKLIRFPGNSLFKLLPSAAAIFITVSMVIYPEEAFNASIHGLNIWWTIVFPALLPFFIMAQVLIGLGVVHMIGVFLEPVMRPLFNVPGVGSFVMAMGLASGFPLGAIITADMRRNKMVEKVEAERLLSFVNTADPLFMFGAVAVGMIGLPEVGFTIAAAHYLSTLTVGVVMRFYRRHESSGIPNTGYSRQENVFLRAIKAQSEARRKDGRPIGQLLGDAVTRSVNTLLLIGGFIILFSVIIRILEVIGVINALSSLVSPVLGSLGISTRLTPAIISGLLELDLGCQFAAESTAPLLDVLVISSFIIAWSGLSVHAQVASIISDTDINIKPFIWARMLHGFLAGLYTYLLSVIPISLLQNQTVPVFYQRVPTGDLSYMLGRTLGLTQHLALFCALLLLFSFLLYLLKKIIPIFVRRPF